MKRNCSKLLIFCSGSARGLRSLGRQLHCRTSRSLVSLCEFNDEWVEVDLAASDDAYYWNRTMNKIHWKLPANVHLAWSQKCPGRGSAPYFIHISRGKRLERIPENHEMASTKKTAAETLCKLPTTASANAHQKSIPDFIIYTNSRFGLRSMISPSATQ